MDNLITSIKEIKNNLKVTQYSYDGYIITIEEYTEKSEEIAECWINEEQGGIKYHVVGVVKCDEWLNALLNSAIEYIECRKNNIEC